MGKNGGSPSPLWFYGRNKEVSLSLSLSLSRSLARSLSSPLSHDILAMTIACFLPCYPVINCLPCCRDFARPIRILPVSFSLEDMATTIAVVKRQLAILVLLLEMQARHFMGN